MDPETYSLLVPGNSLLVHGTRRNRRRWMGQNPVVGGLSLTGTAALPLKFNKLRRFTPLYTRTISPWVAGCGENYAPARNLKERTLNFEG